jgi:hypothetical protein
MRPSTQNEARCASRALLAPMSLPASASIAPERASTRLITRTAATVITAGLLNAAKAASGPISPSKTQTIRLVMATMS